jgi:hypothetical protein
VLQNTGLRISLPRSCMHPIPMRIHHTTTQRRILPSLGLGWAQTLAGLDDGGIFPTKLAVHCPSSAIHPLRPPSKPPTPPDQAAFRESVCGLGPPLSRELKLFLPSSHPFHVSLSFLDIPPSPSLSFFILPPAFYHQPSTTNLSFSPLSPPPNTASPPRPQI